MALSLPAIALAQEADDATLLEAIVVTAGGYEQTIKEAPASISVIGQDDLKKKAVADLSEAIRTVPGVNVGFGSNGTRGISMRGLGSSYTLILIDGKRVNAGATTLRKYNGDLNWVPLDAIERIEVVRGPMSTLYGSDAMGGVVNIITKKASNRWTGSLTSEALLPASAATGKTHRLGGYVSGPVLKDLISFSAYGNISRRQADNPAYSNDIEVPRGTQDFDLTGRLTLTPTDDQTIKLELGHAREKYNPFLAPGDVDPETSIERTTASLGHEGQWEIGKSTTNLYFEDATNTTKTTGIDIESRNYALDSKLALDPLDYFFTHHLIVGGEVRLEKLNDPANLGKSNTVTGSTGSPKADFFTGALFAEDKVEFNDRFSMTAGLRYDYHEQFGSHFSPRTYFMYELTDTVALRTGWAQAFKAPNLRQLDPNWVTTSRGRGCGAVGGPCEMVGNPDLKPETSNSFEVGLTYDDSEWKGGLTYFFNDMKNKITSARTASLILPNGTKYVQQINVDRARSQGIEGSLTIPVHADLSWTNSFTYLLESKNLETNMPLSADPELSVHSEVTWRPRENLSFTASYDYYGKQVDYVSTPETLIAQNVDPYSIFSISTKFDMNDNFSFKAGINNLFDAQPATTSNYKEDGRTYFLSMTSTF